MKHHYLVFVACALVLSGCAGHTAHVIGRTNGTAAQDTFRVLNPGRDVRFTLGEEAYSGRWVYVEGSGSIGLGTLTSASGSQTVISTGTLIGLPTGGNGTYIGASPSGATLRCSFTFSENNLKGVGLCQDSKGEAYDLQIE